MSKKQQLIEESLKIIEELNALDILLTFRQLYYQLVSKLIITPDWNSYKYLNKIISEARYKGLIPYDAIVDDKRLPSVSHYYEETVEDHIEYVFDRIENTITNYTFPKWINQPQYIEIWIEKQALFRLFKKITDQHDVTLVASSGYPSVSLLNTSANRITAQLSNRNVSQATILYFGDFDPSGKDIPRNILAKLTEEFEVNVKLELIALNKKQIEFHELPPMPTKKKDSRLKSFEENYGKFSVELDALPPLVLLDMIDDTILEYFDKDIYETVKSEEDEIKERLKSTFELVEEDINTIAEQFKEEYERR